MMMMMMMVIWLSFSTATQRSTDGLAVFAMEAVRDGAGGIDRTARLHKTA